MKRALWLWLPWTIFIVLAAGWIAYWHIVANQAEQRVRAWAAEQNAQGAAVEIGAIARRGFPVLLSLDLRDLAYAPARGGWRAATAHGALHIQLLNPQHVIFKAEAPIAILRADGAFTNIAAGALIASVRMSGRSLAQAGVEADNLTLDDPAQEGVLRARRLVINVRPDPRAVGDLQLAFDAQGLTLPRPVRSFETFGLDVSALRAAIVLQEAGALLRASPEDPLAPWREAGGQLRFEALLLNWGPLEATGTGHGGLDDQRRLTGVLNLPIERPAAVFTALSRGENVDESARQALRLLSTAYTLSGDDITLDVEAQNGVLRLEGLAVRPLPPVY